MRYSRLLLPVVLFIDTFARSLSTVHTRFPAQSILFFLKQPRRRRFDASPGGSYNFLRLGFSKRSTSQLRFDAENILFSSLGSSSPLIACSLGVLKFFGLPHRNVVDVRIAISTPFKQIYTRSCEPFSVSLSFSH